ncbi:MAG: glucose-6-phosphate isomerase [Myxococcales bacterium]|nr:glucose-6-phosphate isomerase [Myxococcales bacterium]
MHKNQAWEHFCESYWWDEQVPLRIDLSRMGIPESFWEEMTPAMGAAFEEMQGLEQGAIANADEQRMVGHYWLRDAKLAPTAAIREEIETSVKRIKDFAHAIHSGQVRPTTQPAFTRFLQIGIGGSALGPQLVYDALRTSTDEMEGYFLDNTDPDGIDRLLMDLGEQLSSTLVLIVSKSGGTKETHNGMLEIKAAFEARGLPFERHAVAITGAGSKLDDLAQRSGMLDTFPIWDWVGGRTSLLSPVGLLPAALQGVDIETLLAGAAAMDVCTRRQIVRENPAARLALSWHYAGDGRGQRDMVVLPYKDRLLLLSRYLQQLVMESLGKELDRQQRVVNQGLSVYGNKGSTDQHAFVQQLRDGADDFFVTFIEVLQDRKGNSMEVEEEITSGDYLLGFLYGTRQALWESGRRSLHITLPEVSAKSLGMLIALFERAVGLYASLININAYHQPGVEAGKKAAGAFLSLQKEVMALLRAHPQETFSVPALAEALQRGEQMDAIFYIAEHLAANGRLLPSEDPPLSRTYQLKS